jgi:hypothetical protein
MSTLAIASSARADDAPIVPAPTRTWYGWQTLAIDAGAFAAFAPYPAYISTPAAPLFISLAAAAIIAAPIVHAFHHRWDAFGNSLALRLGIMTAATFLGAGIAANLVNDAYNAIYVTDLLGAALASTLDASLLGWQRHGAYHTTVVSWSVAPNMLPRGAGLTLTLY